VKLRVWLLVLGLFLPAWLRAADPVPHAVDIPPWFAETFLDFRDDLKEAARADRRVMIYFGQDGCPYCRELMQTNFTQKAIVDKMRRHLMPVALNIWGDREVTWVDGSRTTEKELAKRLKVQFTPTLLFLDEKGEVVVRLNGYVPPHRLSAALDYVAGKMESRRPLAEYMQTAVREPAADKLHDEPFFIKPPYDLRRKPGGKPLAVVFETRYCSGCDELHKEGFRRPEVQDLLPKFDLARFSLSDKAELTRPDGARTTAEAWARELKVSYTPTIVFFDDRGQEVFRIEAYLRPFHLATSFDYVASGAFRTEPEFQRFIQAKAERMRAQGKKIELWK
jgi:thioredoxin-related protein